MNKHLWMKIVITDVFFLIDGYSETLKETKKC